MCWYLAASPHGENILGSIVGPYRLIVAFSLYFLPGHVDMQSRVGCAQTKLSRVENKRSSENEIYLNSNIKLI